MLSVAPTIEAETSHSLESIQLLVNPNHYKVALLLKVLMCWIIFD